MRLLMCQLPISLQFSKAVKDNIPSLVRVYMDAFADDNAARLMFKESDDPRRKMQDMLELSMTNPNASIIKAVDKENDSIVAWIGFGSIGYPGSSGVDANDVAPRIEYAEHSTIERSKMSLGSTVSKDFVRMKNEWMSDKQYTYIGTLLTDPAYQGRGIGTTLMRWATSKGDADRVPCWLESSPNAQGLYHRMGFRSVGTLEVDLSDFAPGGKDGKRGWGAFHYVYMLRLPKAKEAS